MADSLNRFELDGRVGLPWLSRDGLRCAGADRPRLVHHRLRGGIPMPKTYDRDELVARLVRAGELEVSGEHPDEVGDYFAPGFEFHGPGSFESDFDGLQ